MTDMAVVVLAEVEEFNGTAKATGKPFTKYTLKDGNGVVLGDTFDGALAKTARDLKGQRVEVDTKPSDNPKFAPTVTAVRKAVGAAANGDGGAAALSKDEWRQKDAAGDKRACIAIAAGALTKTLPEQPTDADLEAFAKRVDRMAHYWFELVQRQRDPVPFE